MPSVPVSAGATSVTVPGAFVLPYQLALSTDWLTTIPTITKTVNSFTVNFSVASPGGNLSYFVLGPANTVPSGTGVLLGYSIPIADNALSVTVTGVFPIPYEVLPNPNWFTDIEWSNKQATQFTLAFSVPPFTGGSNLLDVIIVVPVVPNLLTTGTLAGDIITNIRDEIPDPVYDASGNPLPDANGAWRASTLYGWLNDGVKIMARLCGTIVTDWTAVFQRAAQPWYELPIEFQTITDGFSLQWPLDIVTINESDVIWPTTGRQMNAQSLWGYIRRRTNRLEFGEFPAPVATDPITPLVTSLAAAGETQIVLTDPTNFLSFGYVQIDAEIIQYQFLNGNLLQTLSRGVCNTVPAIHQAGTPVIQLGLWLKGTRIPSKITNSLSLVELPEDIIPDVKTYVMSRVRGSENEFEEAKSLRKRFDDACAQIRADPTRKEQVGLAPAYGEPRVGYLYWINSGGVILP